MPNEIADSAGFTGGAMPSDDLKAVVKKVFDSNPEVVKKIVENKKSGPIMSLVGQVM
jgi:Asp-tRNA(Asn)/Glu-tRNA(Gln) amidotransferase B subunit